MSSRSTPEPARTPPRRRRQAAARRRAAWALCAVCSAASGANADDGPPPSESWDAPLEAPDADPDSPWSQNPAIESSLRQVLADEQFAFCHDNGYRLWPQQKAALCPVEPALARRCPELPHACQRPAWGEAEHDAEVEPPGWDLSPLAIVVRPLFWALGLLGIAALLYAIAKSFRADLRVQRASGEPPELERESAPAPVLETDVDRLLARARAEAARGDYAAALISAHAAAVHGLSERGLLKLHRSRTNGDYVRQLNAHRGEQQTLRALVREVENVQFGGKSADAPVYERVAAAARHLATRTAPLVALLLSLFTAGCSSEAPQLPEPENSPTSPEGFAALEAVLQRHAQEVRRRVRQVNEPPDSEVGTLVVVRNSLRKREWEHVLSWVEQGGTLVVGGVSQDLAELLNARELETVACKGSIDAPPLDLRAAHAAQAFKAQGTGEPLLRCGDHPVALYWARGDGHVYAFADDTWFTNAALGTADNAQVIVRLGQEPEGKVELLGPWTGGGTEAPWQSIHNAGLTPVLLQLLLLAAAWAVARGVRFQTPTEPVRQLRRAFVEHAGALAAQYERANASSHALESYGRWAVERLRERVPVRERDLHALATAVAWRAGTEPRRVFELLVEAQSASQTRASADANARTLDELTLLLRRVGVIGEPTRS